jgi:4-amino-4-deoxy-L-arabinose transferase-like glycosyltransferase
MRNKIREITSEIDNPEIFIIIFFFILVFFIRGIGFQIPFERDEGEYAYSAWISRSGGNLYKDAFLQKPPGIVYTYLASQLVFGDNVWGPRVFGMLFILITSFLTALIAAKIFNNKAFYSALLITPVMESFPSFMGLSANTEIFMLTPLMAFVACFVYSENNEKRKYWICAAIFAVLALMFKPICIYLIVFVYVWWIYRNKKRAFEFLVFSLIAGSLTVMIMVIPILKNFNYFWEEVVVYNSIYIKSLGFKPINFINNMYSFLKTWWVLIPFILVYLIKVKNRMVILLFIFAIFGAINSGVGHYYLIMIPFVALIVAGGLQELSKSIKVNRYIILIILIFIMVMPFRTALAVEPERLVLWIYGVDNPFYESKIIAEIIDENSKWDDKIFIAGSEPQIYYYAKRRSTNRFVITYPLVIPSSVDRQYQNEAVVSLEKNKPALIVISNRATSGYNSKKSLKILKNYLDNLIENEYELVGGYLWAYNREGSWINSDKLNYNEIDQTSLLVYKRK